MAIVVAGATQGFAMLNVVSTELTTTLSRYVTASSLLTFTHTARGNFPRVSVLQRFLPYHDVLAMSTQSVDITQNFMITNRAAIFKAVTTLSQIMLSHAAVPSKTSVARSALTLSQSVNVWRGITQKIILTQAVLSNGIFNPSLSASLNLSQSVLAYFQNRPLAVWSSNPARTKVKTQFIDGIETIELRSPDFGNVNAVEQIRIQRRTRGNDIRIGRDALWPKTERLRLRFTGLTSEMKERLLKFFRRNAGKDVTYRDYENLTWIITIVEPNAKAIDETKKDADCSPTYAFEMEFEGARTI